MTGVDVERTLPAKAADVAVGREAGLYGPQGEGKDSGPFETSGPQALTTPTRKWPRFVARRLVDHLERAGFVVMKRPRAIVILWEPFKGDDDLW
jgi:hypothetical protein